MKAFVESGHALAHPAGLILLFGGEVDLRRREPAKIPDEHNKADILTSGLNLASAFPVQ